jgi:uridine kinase
VRVALLISGYLRSFEVNLPLIKNKILDRFDSIDTYVHITKDEFSSDKYLNPVEKINLDLIEKNLSPKVLLVEKNFFSPKEMDRNNLINSWSKYYKLHNLKKVNEGIEGEYDLVIKYRPDLVLTKEFLIPNDFDKNKIYIPKNNLVDKTKLKNPNDNFICDIFAYGGSSSMDKYFEIFSNLPVLIENFGSTSETLLYEYLNEKKIPINLVDIEYSVILSSCNVFAICGDSGSGKSTLGKILKKYFSKSFMLECDRYHKWERGDKNWDKLTHLHPDANYLTKMSSDIFDLKIGKTVYQVDYDHKSGKFTEKEQINSSDNIIVCGLHSLYTNNNHLFNLKIFMDTQFELKRKWKLKRDVEERGHKHENVIKQMELRNSDYEKFILPQKNDSDMVVNFFINENEKIGLKLLTKKEFDLTHIISFFNQNKTTLLKDT